MKRSEAKDTIGTAKRGTDHGMASTHESLFTPERSEEQKLDIAGSLRLAMRRLAATVTIITTKSDIGNLAIVATAVSSLSLDPPSILACVNRKASIHTYLQPHQPFAINFLGAIHHKVALHCANAISHQDRFAVGSWPLHDSIPYLAGAQATLFATVNDLIAQGSHSIVIGHVHDVLMSGEPDPLVYVNGAYGRVEHYDR